MSDQQTSVFGGTFVLKSMIEDKIDGDLDHWCLLDVLACPICLPEIKSEFSDWVTDQCIKQGLSYERQGSI